MAQDDLRHEETPSALRARYGIDSAAFEAFATGKPVGSSIIRRGRGQGVEQIDVDGLPACKLILSLPDEAFTRCMIVAGGDWNSLQSEEWREYHFPDGNIVRITGPAALRVSPNGHRVVTNDGMGHYVPTGWHRISWRPKKGCSAFDF
jgi:hypothetical protein